MKKTFILDTNVLLHDVNCMRVFEDNDIIIPMAVIEELDAFKTEGDTRGKNARMVSRMLDDMRKKGRLNEGIKLDKGGVLKIVLDLPNSLPYSMAFNKADNAILNIAYTLGKKEGSAPPPTPNNLRGCKNVKLFFKIIISEIFPDLLGLKEIGPNCPFL